MAAPIARELIRLQVRRGVLEPQVEPEPVGRAPIEVERAKPGRVRAIVRDGSFIHVVRLRDQVWTCTGCEQVGGVRCRHVEAVRKSSELRRAKRDAA